MKKQRIFMNLSLNIFARLRHAYRGLLGFLGGLDGFHGRGELCLSAEKYRRVPGCAVGGVR